MGPELVFPVIRGVQARREYYVSMCPLRLLPKLFLFNEEELSPELRAQRLLNKGRLPEIARYMLDNRDTYVFSAITCSINGAVRFDPLGSGQDSHRLGLLHVPMSAQLLINDGQHRRAAIEMALEEGAALADESIAVVFFMDEGLERSQQMFADLNRHAIRPSKSLGVLYDHRDSRAKLAKLVVFKSQVFKGVVEMERTTLAMRARKLFTLSAIYTATTALLTHTDAKSDDDNVAVAVSFWDEVGKHFPEWRFVRERKMAAGEVRRDFIHSHGIALHALGITGNALLRERPEAWRGRLKPLEALDWSRSNTKLWEGRAMIGGRVSKAAHNVILTANVLKGQLGLQLTPEEQRVEDAFTRSEHAR